jgi:hypothetical protein
MLDLENGDEAGRLLRDYVRRLVYASPTESPEADHNPHTLRPTFHPKGSQDHIASAPAA